MTTTSIRQSKNAAKATSRRGFLKKSGGTLAGVLSFAGGPIALLAPSQSWALELTTLNDHVGATILKFTRHLYPHESLEDAVYALVVKDLDAAASADEPTARLLNDGVALIDKTASGKWLSLNESRQLELVTALETSVFFQKIRSTAIVSLYNNELAFAHFGYEGPAFSKGGYIGRGFNDLDWLPEPSENASPSAS